MLFDLDDDTQLLQKTVRDFATGEVAELLSKAKRPDCKSLDERIFKSTGERTSLAIHWDLPKTMKNGVPMISAAAIRMFAVTLSTLSVWVRKNSA